MMSCWRDTTLAKACAAKADELLTQPRSDYDDASRGVYLDEPGESRTSWHVNAPAADGVRVVTGP